MPLFRRQFTLLPAVGLLLGAVGCNVTTTSPLGRLSAKVIDANNAGVQGVLLDLYKVEGGRSILWRAIISSSDGIGEFGASDGGVIAGEYFIRVRFVTQHELAPGESNDRPVTMNEGDNIVVTVRVVPKNNEHELAQIAKEPANKERLPVLEMGVLVGKGVVVEAVARPRRLRMPS
jgi:hypothetical protein